MQLESPWHSPEPGFGMAGVQKAGELDTLPWRRQKSNFNPPTQGKIQFAHTDSRQTIDTENIHTSPSVVRSRGSASSNSFQASGSFVAMTPSMLWPQTPSPAATMHPNFSQNFGSGGYASMVAIQAPPSANPSTSGPAPPTPMVWLQMPMTAPAQSQASDLPTLLSARTGPTTNASLAAIAMQGSAGSALHGTGNCQPCAWFWKAGRGCQNASTCSYCHLCPDGELKTRKKAKLNAIRMGVLEPSQPRADNSRSAAGAATSVAGSGTHWQRGRLKLAGLLRRMS